MIFGSVRQSGTGERTFGPLSRAGLSGRRSCWGSWVGVGTTVVVPPKVCSLVPNFMFFGAEMWEYSPQNCQNLEFLP